MKQDFPSYHAAKYVLLPRLYAILDAETCARRGFTVRQVAEAWREAGIRLVQYRDKRGSDAEVLENAAALRWIMGGCKAKLVLNDRLHLFRQSGLDGVHVGQSDPPIAQVRAVAGARAMVGISTHNPAQLRSADAWDVSYVAAGPVFATGTKLDAEPVIGFDGIRAARAVTGRPLVAIGGITRANAAEVLAAGADSVAIISGLLPPGGSPVPSLVETARELLEAVAER